MVLCLGVESVRDLEKLLREMGYSGKAAKEILKWYKRK